jgi:protocatechuate 3,4-dioxygenase alpha subunit
MVDEKTREFGATPSQTVGPFFHDALTAEDHTRLVDENHPGAILLHGTVYDGAGDPVPDAMVEIWQADQEGRYAHPEDPAGGSPDEFGGLGRSATDAEGRFEFVTVKPGHVAGPGDTKQAPHLLVTIFARGLLKQLVTRLYFPDEERANAADPVFLEVGEDLRATLVAETESSGRLRFDIRLQEGPNGEPETVFFDV